MCVSRQAFPNTYHMGQDLSKTAIRRLACVCNSLSVFLSVYIYLPIYTSYSNCPSSLIYCCLKGTNYARLPSKVKVFYSKAKQCREQSCTKEGYKLQNAQLLQDFLKQFVSATKHSHASHFWQNARFSTPACHAKPHPNFQR